MKFSERRTPPETEEDHAFIWSAAEKAHELWAVLGVVVAILNNWKGVMIGAGIGFLLGGKDLLLALGVVMP